MKEKKIILLLIAFCFNTYYPQTINVTFYVTDGNFSLSPIWVGLDSTATNGLDPHLGEIRLPFFEGFYAAFDITQYTGTPTQVFKDYRNAPTFPVTDTIEHELGWQLSLWGDAFIIYYNLPMGITANFKDFLGGVFYNETFSDTGSFSVPESWGYRGYLTMYYENVLPVELLSFTASMIKNNSAIKLEWITTTEKNNSGFQIERKLSENTNRYSEWETIGFVEGHGTTTEPNSYSFVDEGVSSGIYKYRLKQIDFDGTYEYSNEIEVNVDLIPKEFVLYQNYPNPFNPTTKIKFTIPINTSPLPGGARGGLVILKVYDILGNEVATLINENKPAGSYEVEFDASEFASGVYVYKLSAENFIAVKKMILIK